MNQKSLLSLKNEIGKTKKDKHTYYFICIDGIGGTGKTVMATLWALLTHDSYEKVYANYNIDVPNFVKLPQKLSKAVILNLTPNSLLVLTEAYLYFDCRESIKKKNREITHALFQARKMGIDIIYDIPSFNYTELRIKAWTKLIIHARGHIKRNDDIFEYDYARYVPSLDDDIIFKRGIKYNMSSIFKYFDSFEITDKQPLLNQWENKI